MPDDLERELERRLAKADLERLRKLNLQLRKEIATLVQNIKRNEAEIVARETLEYDRSKRAVIAQLDREEAVKQREVERKARIIARVREEFSETIGQFTDDAWWKLITRIVEIHEGT